MKILFLSEEFPPENAGGSGIIAHNLAHELKNLGHDVFIITCTERNSEEKEADIDGLRVFKVCGSYHSRWQAWLSLYNPLTVPKIEKIVKNIKPDIVHAHNIHNYISYYSLKIAKKYAKAVFLTAHDVMLVHWGKLMPKNGNCFYKVTTKDQIKEAGKRYNPFRRVIIKHYLRYVDKIFTVSDAIKKILAINGINNTETIHNGINVEEWKFSPLEIKKFNEKYNLQNKKIILFAGRLSGAKGGHEILRAISLVKDEIKNVILLVAGEKNKYFEEMNKLIENLNIDEYVKFTGWLSREEMKSAFFASDISVTPSIYLDPFPTVNLEAMASRKPIIGTCFGGTSEIVVNNRTGYLVNPLNTKEMADKIIDLLKNPQRMKQFGDEGYKRVKENFSLKRQTEKTLLNYYIFLKKK